MSVRSRAVRAGARVVPQRLLDWVYDHRFNPVVRRVRNLLKDSLGSGHEPVEMTRGPLAGWKLAFGDSPAIWSGVHEPAIQALVEQQIRPGDVVYDVGAHIGYYALLSAKQMAGTGRVIAYEPEPASRALLQRNVDANGVASTVEVRNVALGESSGRGTLLSFAHSGEATLQEGDGDVEVTTLDAEVYERGLPRPTVVIIDTEGMEAPIFRGGERTLREARPRIICEHHNRSAEIDAVLEPLGYQGQTVDLGHTLYTASSAN